jgi:hypothetical protein
MSLKVKILAKKILTQSVLNGPCRPLYHPGISYSNVERRRLLLVKRQSLEESTHCFSEEEEEQVPHPVVLPTTRGPPIFENTFKVRNHCYLKAAYLAVLGVRDVLVRIWIRGSVSLTNGSGTDSFLK